MAAVVSHTKMLPRRDLAGFYITVPNIHTGPKTSAPLHQRGEKRKVLFMRIARFFVLLSLILAIPASTMAGSPAGYRNGDTFCGYREDRLWIPFVDYESMPRVFKVTVCAKVKTDGNTARLLVSEPEVIFQAFVPFSILWRSKGCTGWAKETGGKAVVHGACTVSNRLVKLDVFQDFIVDKNGELDVVYPAYYREKATAD